MALNPRVLSATTLVLAGVVGAVVVGQLPALGVTDTAITAIPASPRQALVCPGPVVAVGAEGTAPDEVTAAGRPSRVAGTAKGADVTSTPLKRGGLDGGGTAPRVLSAAAAPAAGALAGAQVEQVATGDAAGFAAASCAAPVADAWFAAGATTTGRTSVLLLANPSAAAARVAVRIWTEDGPLADTGGTEIAVPAGDRRAVSLAGLAPSAGGLVVRVTSSGARIGAAVEQRTVRGLESGGVDIAGATAAPARRQTITGMRVAGAAAVAETQREDDYGDLQPVVRVLLPGSKPADVAISVRSSAGGAPITAGRRVAAGVVTDFPIRGLADGTWSVEVRSSVPLVAGARVSVVADAGASSTPDDGSSSSSSSSGSGSAADAPVGSDAGLVGGDGPVDTGSGASPATGSPTSTSRGIDLAWFGAGGRLGETAVVAVASGPDPVLSVTSTGVARTVRVSGPVSATLQVPAGGTASLPVARGVLVLSGVGGLDAAVSYAGTAAVAGYSVEPADQEARAVRVTR